MIRALIVRGKPWDTEEAHKILNRLIEFAKESGIPSVEEGCSEIQKKLSKPRRADNPARLTAREIEVLTAIASGETDSSNRTEASGFAVRHGIAGE